MDKEQKIAEIRKSAEEARKTKGSWVDGQDYADDVEFLLNELERLRAERDSHGPEGRNYTIIRQFLNRLDMMAGTGNGIGAATVEKIRQFAIREGFLPKEEAAR